MTALRDLGEDQRARIAAMLIDQLGMPAITPHLPRNRVEPPLPGVAVLACRCGRVIDRRDMRRRSPRIGDTTPIPPIVCPECAR